MTNTLRTITKISSAIVFTLLFCSSVSASEIDNSLNQYSSTYKYSAIENTAPFPNLASNVNISDSQISVNVDIPEISFDKKLQNIVDAYNSSKDQIDNAMDKINNKNGVVTVLVGSNLGILKFQIVQINNQILELKRLGVETAFITEKNKISPQLKILTEEQIKVGDFIFLNENKFSLFGWFVALL